jgi:hypothetical protein
MVAKKIGNAASHKQRADNFPSKSDARVREALKLNEAAHPRRPRVAERSPLFPDRGTSKSYGELCSCKANQIPSIELSGVLQAGNSALARRGHRRCFSRLSNGPATQSIAKVVSVRSCCERLRRPQRCRPLLRDRGHTLSAQQYVLAAGLSFGDAAVMASRRFPPPWSVEDNGACLLFVIRCTHDVKALCRPLSNSYDARAIGGRLARFSSSHKFNLVVPPRRRPMSRGVADRGELCETPRLASQGLSSLRQEVLS